MRSILRFALCVFLSASIHPASAAPEVRVLDNVFVVPDANAKAVTTWMVIQAGCHDEAHANCHGLAHYVEHLVFQGRNADHKTTALRFFADGEVNGFTTERATVFSQSFPLRPEGQTDDLEKLFRFFAQAIDRLEVSDAEAERERKVVLQEYNLRVERSPGRKFFFALNRKLHPRHPAGQPVIGTKADIEAMTLAEAKAFHDDWYTKASAVFVVHGPVDAEAVRAIAAKHLAALPDRKPPERAWRNALFDFEPLDVIEHATEKDVSSKVIAAAKIVRLEEPDRRLAWSARAIAQAFLRSSLDGGPKDVLVDQQEVASQIGVILERVAPGAMDVSYSVTPKDGVSDEAALNAVKAYFDHLAETGIKPETVARLKKRAADARANAAREPEQAARTLVGWFGAHDSYEDYLNRDAIFDLAQAKDVNALLRAIAAPGRQVVGVLSPEPADTAKGTP